MLYATTHKRADGSTYDRVWSDQAGTPNIEAVATVYFTNILHANVELPLFEDDSEDDTNDFFRPRGV
jgi:hypothetical protein